MRRRGEEERREREREREKNEKSEKRLTVIGQHSHRREHCARQAAVCLEHCCQHVQSRRPNPIHVIFVRCNANVRHTVDAIEQGSQSKSTRDKKC